MIKMASMLNKHGPFFKNGWSLYSLREGQMALPFQAYETHLHEDIAGQMWFKTDQTIQDSRQS